jgi:hypothetical protein
MKTCPACGKKFVVMWPQLWAYKRNGNMYLCSWGCLRKFDKKEMENMTDEMKREAVRIVLDGGIPTKFLREQGSRNPTTAWKTIRKWAMQQAEYKDAEIPEKFGRWPKAEEVPTVKIDGPIRIETPEANQVTVAEIPEKKPAKKPGMEYKTTGIATEMGDFRYFKRSGYIDWDPVSDLSTTVSLNVDEWRQLIRDMPEVMRILGVEA